MCSLAVWVCALWITVALARGAQGVETSAAVNGIAVWFDLGLGPGVEISTGPGEASEDNHWRLPVWILPDPVAVKPGETITIRYSYPGPIHRRVTISK